ncbi:MAG: hypothetical protein AB3N63_10335 [Puniceicoccaceae bacterium]
MPPEYLVPIFIVFIVVGLPVLSATLIKLAKIIKGEPEKISKDFTGTSDKEEAELVQDIHRLVTRLEKRIDALETIVIDKTR